MASRELNERLLGMLPREAVEEVAGALHVLRGRRRVLPCEDAMNVLADCCIHDWIGGGGETVVQELARRVVAGSVRLPETEEALLDAWVCARYALFRIDEQWPGAGVLVHDALERESLALLDESLGDGPDPCGIWMAARLAHLGSSCMTTGAATVVGALPDSLVQEIVDALRRIRAGQGPRGCGLALARLGIACESEYHDEPDDSGLLAEPPSPARDLPARRPGRNAPCPCGSGVKFKRCCGR